MALRSSYSKALREAGCDEAGRGCLAGPVFAAAVILPTRWHHPLLQDSKQMSEADREMLRPIIEQKALAWAVAMCTPTEIDEINILQASIRAMHKAIDALALRPQHLLIDGNRFKPYLGIPHTCIVGGDGKYKPIAAASILAKTHRDAWMTAAHEQHPDYHWLENKGYPTRAHREAILLRGPSPLHRLTFKIDGIPIGERFPG